MCIFEQTPLVALHAVQTSETCIRIFGRVHTVREHGRLTFIDVWCNGQRMQVVARGEHPFRVGAWVDVVGPARPTQRGEMSVWMEHMREHSCATQALEMQPDHGRLPAEQRFVVDPALVQQGRMRGRIVQRMRQFLWGADFEEVGTPLISRCASGAAARPFETWSRAQERQLFLRVAPESHLIRLLMAGFDSVFEIGACFRNEGVSERHQPQFDLLECYRLNETVDQSMDRLEQLLHSTLDVVHTDLSMVPWGSETLNWGHIRRHTLEELVEQYTGCVTSDMCVQWLQERNLWHEGNDPMLAWCVVFEVAVEQQLRQPTFVTRWPCCVSPLARETDNGWSARFELYAAGMELANGYEQERDRTVQQQRFEQQAQLLGQEDVMASDEEYLFAMNWGMPPLSGFGLGIDRWIQIVTNQAHIRDVVLFPM